LVNEKVLQQGQIASWFENGKKARKNLMLDWI
jgi:hypothetical protein